MRMKPKGYDTPVFNKRVCLRNNTETSTDLIVPIEVSFQLQFVAIIRGVERLTLDNPFFVQFLSSFEMGSVLSDWPDESAVLKNEECLNGWEGI